MAKCVLCEEKLGFLSGGRCKKCGLIKPFSKKLKSKISGNHYHLSFEIEKDQGKTDCFSLSFDVENEKESLDKFIRNNRKRIFKKLEDRNKGIPLVCYACKKIVIPAKMRGSCSVCGKQLKFQGVIWCLGGLGHFDRKTCAKIAAEEHGISKEIRKSLLVIGEKN